MYGLEFLVYLPDVKHEQKFATFFCGNPTARVAAKNFAPIIRSKTNKAATLKSEVIDNGTYIWEGPVVLPCNSPLSRYPEQADMITQMETFLNPIEGEAPEMVTDEEEAATTGREH
jgi:hypothetical protein